MCRMFTPCRCMSAVMFTPYPVSIVLTPRSLAAKLFAMSGRTSLMSLLVASRTAQMCPSQLGVPYSAIQFASGLRGILMALVPGGTARISLMRWRHCCGSVFQSCSCSSVSLPFSKKSPPTCTEGSNFSLISRTSASTRWRATTLVLTSSGLSIRQKIDCPLGARLRWGVESGSSGGLDRQKLRHPKPPMPSLKARMSTLPCRSVFKMSACPLTLCRA
mmetsp:Transcript_29464/g.66001  ORF Transcript_29464/g.66001 Transcript_29464/m.66001 type:complete len:218 (-) Transcript_29464:1040-1693(-)